MRSCLSIVLLVLALAGTGTAWGLCLDISKPLPAVTLDDTDHHHSGQIIYNSQEQRLQYLPWNSDSLTGKTYVLYHLAARQGIDQINDAFIKALGNLPAASHQLVVILNIDDVFIGGKIFARNTFEDHAKKDGGHTLFVLDDHSAVREHWCINEQSSTIIVLNAQGEVIEAKDGALTDTEIQHYLESIRKAYPDGVQ
jgi:YtfJ family uncharacterized protein